MSPGQTASHRSFQATLWSQVCLAAGMTSPQSQPALEDLCARYWYPIYAFLRRAGEERQDARDLTQGFFQYLLQHRLLAKANPERGRFRSFLIGVLKNYVRSERSKEHALRRGGGAERLSFNEETAESRYAHEAAPIGTPERLFDRRWALQVITQALELLQMEYARAGQAESFAALQPYLTGDDAATFATLATQLGVNEGAARGRVFRLRERFRQLIRGVIADTVLDPNQVDDELEHLQAALREG